MKANKQKHLKAITKLGEVYGELLPTKFLTQFIENKKIAESEIYNELEFHNFTWENGKWKKRESPVWIKDAIKKFETGLKNSHVLSHQDAFQPHKLGVHGRINFFYEYLDNMESFIENEIKDREEEFENLKDSIVDEVDVWLVDVEIADYDLKTVTAFSSVLRNSFFVNLHSYMESLLVELYKASDNKESLKDSIIKTATKKIIAPLPLSKIPNWQTITDYLNIRNCLVHKNGHLSTEGASDRDHKILKFGAQHGLIDGNRIRLTSQFCTEALKNVHSFLQTVIYVAKESGKL